MDQGDILNESLQKDIAQLALIDISAFTDPELSKDQDAKLKCAKEIDQACRTYGFFRIKGHGIPNDLQARLDAESRKFFNLSEEDKKKISMDKGGSAWRGWFPVGGELTSGRPDRKEGLYCGEELSDEHPKVK